jgi:hypothetical protein
VQVRNQQALDPRLIQVSIEVNGRLKTYSQLAIMITGTKYANPLQNECEVTLYNLDKATQDYLLTETSPYNLNRTPKTVIVKAGRVSYGAALVYTGNIIYSRVTQPPDIGITLKCLTGNFLKGNILSLSYPSGTPLSVISKQLAANTQTALQFQATDKTISNYSYAGSVLQQVNSVSSLGNYNVFIDNNTLVVKDGLVPLTGVVRILDADSGMIGIPEFTEQGIKVKFLLDNRTTLGGALDIRSTVYPAANGIYVIYKLGFEIATRDTPFYWIAEGARLR